MQEDGAAQGPGAPLEEHEGTGTRATPLLQGPT